MKRILISIVVVLIAVVAGWRLLGHHTPKGQPALVNLSRQNFADFEREFNTTSGTKIVALLSPT